MDGDFVRDCAKLIRKPLDTRDDECGVGQAGPFGAPRTVRERVRACVDRDGEELGVVTPAMHDVAAVARAHVRDDAAERGGQRSDLTDVYVDEPLTDEPTHAPMVAALPLVSAPPPGGNRPLPTAV